MTPYILLIVEASAALLVLIVLAFAVKALRRPKAPKTLADVKKEIRAPPTPPAVPIEGTPAGFKTLEEFAMTGKKLQIEWTRIKEGTLKRMTVRKGAVAFKANWRGALPRILLFPQRIGEHRGDYYIKPQKIIQVTATKGVLKKTEETVYKLVYDVLFAEPLNQDGSITYDDDLEMVLADSGLDQYVEIAASGLGFQLTPTLRNVMIIIAFLGVLLGLALNGQYHFVPTVIVRWIP
jgi:hypothetical protein